LRASEYNPKCERAGKWIVVRSITVFRVEVDLERNDG
jgi:hypothetical protein